MGGISEVDFLKLFYESCWYFSLSSIYSKADQNYRTL
jgi:hypothetical protein